MQRSEQGATPVRIQLDKINPFQIVTVKDVVLDITGSEKTAFRFTVDKEGEVSDVNELPKTLTTETVPPLSINRGR